MKTAIRIFTLICLVTSFLVPSGIFAAPPVDALWQRAVAAAEADKDLAPGTMFVRMEQLDEKGRSLNLERSWYRIFPDPKGQVVSEPVKVLQNGKDVTKAMKKQTEALKKEGIAAKDGDLGLTGCNPFAPENQRFVTVRPLNRKIVINARPCLVYGFTYRESRDNIISGTAWLEEVTGVPQKILYSPRNLPPYVRTMKNTIWYKMTEEGNWVVERMLFDVNAQYLMIKKRFRTFVKYDKYWLRQREAEQKPVK